MKNTKLTAGKVSQYPTNRSAKKRHFGGEMNIRGMKGVNKKTAPNNAEANSNNPNNTPRIRLIILP